MMGGSMPDLNETGLKTLMVKIIPLVVAAACVAALLVLMGSDDLDEVKARVPGTDLEGVVLPPPEASPAERVRLETLDGVPADLPGAWPQFRGASGDGVSVEGVALEREWPETGPEQLWGINVGEGHAGAAVLNGRVYVMDYDREKSEDVLRCVSLADGRDIWRYSYPVKIKRNHGMSRTVPAVTDKYVVAMGPKCHVICVDAATGEGQWFLDLAKDYGAVVPPWYAGQCPLIDDGKAILAPGGDDVLMMAVECRAPGKVLWKTPNPMALKMSHASIIPMQFNGRRMHVYCASGGLVGVSAEDGRVLWQTNEWKIRIATVPTPVVVGEGRLFLSGGYNAGAMMLQLEEKDGVISPVTVFRLDATVFGSAQHTPVFYEGNIYGVRPDGQLVCLDPAGSVLWTSGTAERFGLGPYLIADGMIYVMDDSGTLTLAEASPAGYVRIARAKVLDGHDSWGPMAIAGGRLIVRNLTRMVCLDVRRKP